MIIMSCRTDNEIVEGGEERRDGVREEDRKREKGEKKKKIRMEKRNRGGGGKEEQKEGGERDVHLLCQYRLHYPIAHLKRPNVPSIHRHLPLHARRFILDS